MAEVDTVRPVPGRLQNDVGTVDRPQLRPDVMYIGRSHL